METSAKVHDMITLKTGRMVLKTSATDCRQNKTYITHCKGLKLQEVFYLSGVLADEMYCFCLVLAETSTSLVATLWLQASKF